MGNRNEARWRETCTFLLRSSAVTVSSRAVSHEGIFRAQIVRDSSARRSGSARQVIARALELSCAVGETIEWRRTRPG